MTDQLTERLDKLRIEEEKHRASGNMRALQVCLGQQGFVLHQMGDLEQSLEMFEKQEGVCRRSDFTSGLVGALRSRATIMLDQNMSAEAMEVYREVESICRNASDIEGLQRVLGDMALLLTQERKYEDAMNLLKEKEQVSRSNGFPNGIAEAYASQAILLYLEGVIDEAVMLMSEAHELAVRHNHIELLQNIEPILADLIRQRENLNTNN